MSIKQKVCSYYLRRKVVFRKWILVVTVVSGLVVIRFSSEMSEVGSFVVVLMCLGQKSISFLGPSIWKKLSNNLKILNTAISFIHNYEKLVLKKLE